MTRRVLSSEAREFRELIIDRLWGEHGVYVDEDHFVGTCVICGDPIGVVFDGYAARAKLNCHTGCTEAELASQLGLEVLP